MIKQPKPFLIYRFGYDTLLEFQSFSRIEIVAHYPRQCEMMPGRYQIGESVYDPAPAIEPPRLHRLRVALDSLHLQAFDDLVVVRFQFELPRLDQRFPVSR